MLGQIKNALLYFAVAHALIAPAIGFSADSQVRDSKIQKLFEVTHKKLEDRRKAMRDSDIGDWTIMGEISTGLKDGYSSKTIEPLVKVISAAPDEPWNIAAYERLVNTYSMMGEMALAQQWAHRGAAAIERILEAPNRKPWMLGFVQMHRRFYKRFSNFSAYDSSVYQKERPFYVRLLALPEYREWQDLILLEQAEMELQMEHCDSVIDICEKIDRFYGSLPDRDSEKDRLLHNRLKAKAIAKKGQYAEAAKILEDLSKSPYAYAQAKNLKKEAAQIAQQEGGGMHEIGATREYRFESPYKPGLGLAPD